MIVSDQKINNSENDIDKDLKESINIAFNNIYKFHKNQAFNSKKTETTPGVFCWQEKRAIENVGLYIPGGTAPLFIIKPFFQLDILKYLQLQLL